MATSPRPEFPYSKALSGAEGKKCTTRDEPSDTLCCHAQQLTITYDDVRCRRAKLGKMDGFAAIDAVFGMCINLPHLISTPVVHCSQGCGDIEYM